MCVRSSEELWELRYWVLGLDLKLNIRNYLFYEMLTTANEYYNVKSTILIIAGTARSSEWICENSNYELKDNNWPEKSVICIFRSCNCRSWKSKTKRLISIKFSISAGLLETVKICGNWNIEFWGWLENWIFEIFSFSEMF